MMNYDELFEWMEKEEPATEANIRFLKEKTLLPLTDEEIKEANESHWTQFKESVGKFDAKAWSVPEGSFPESFINFLCWSNGGSFERGERRFEPFFSPQEIREMLLAYEFPEYMKGAVPFGFDGGGVFYIFDMRSGPTDGEYPIYVAGSGALFWDDAVFVSSTFDELIHGRTDPYE